MLVLGSLLALLGASACFDPDADRLTGAGGATTDASTTSGPASTGDGTTSAASNSSAPADSSSTGDPGTSESSTGDPVVGSSSGESSSSGGEPSTGEEPSTEGYGDCENLTPAEACLPGEQCVDLGPASACGSGCTGPGDCPVPPTGFPAVVCNDYIGDGSPNCALECSMGQTCPDGMTCYQGYLCLWQVILAPGVCPDQDLGSTVPQTIMGNNAGLGEDHYLGCGTGGGEDATYQFTTPAAGTYVFDTTGTVAFDTMLAVIDGCGGAELSCNDDANGMLTSQIILGLAAGQTVVIVVDGFSSASGPFTLNISTM